MPSWDYPPRIQYPKSIAKHLLEEKGDYQPLGNHWYQNFLARHPELKTKYSRNLEQSRKNETNLEIIQD
jgi:hypothetical protein